MNGFQKSKGSTEQSSSWNDSRKVRILQSRTVRGINSRKIRMLQSRAVCGMDSRKVRILQIRAIVEWIPEK